MPDGLKAVYKCAGGSDFPVEWADAEEAKATWFWDAEHSARAATPLDMAAWLGGASGAGRARVESGFAATDWFFSGTRHFNGFWFYRERPLTDEEKARRVTAEARLREQWGTSAGFWQQRCEPRCIASIEDLRSAAPETSLRQLIDTYAYGFEQTFVLDGIEDPDIKDFLRDDLGAEAERTAADLMAGYPTATLEGNQALWELAQEAKQPPALAALLEREPAPGFEEITSTAGSATFVAGFNSYLDHYGGRTSGWDISSPTLRERPDLVLQLIRRTIAEDLPEPASLVAAAATRREQVIEQLEDRFRSDPAKLAAFRGRLAETTTHLPVKEGRALWQLTLAGALRGAVLDRGRRLAEAGAIVAADDVFYLLPDEIDRALNARASRDASSHHPEPPPFHPEPVEGPPASSPSATLRQLVAERRAEHERWLAETPPESIGGNAPVEAPSGKLAEIKGIAASKGVVTGTARVLATYEQFDKLRPGDILVCATTTPAWTPLFGIAAAVVAEGGGVLSHTAIAAREYGIAAVVGLRAATSLIPDGALITVDGTTGVVRLGA